VTPLLKLASLINKLDRKSQPLTLDLVVFAVFVMGRRINIQFHDVDFMKASVETRI